MGKTFKENGVGGGEGSFKENEGGGGGCTAFPRILSLLAHVYSFRVRVSILRSGTKILIQLTRELLYLVQEPLLYR